MTTNIVGLNELTIATEAMVLTIGGKEIKIDLAGLMKLPEDSEDCWIDIAPLMEFKKKGMRPKEFLRKKETKAYIVEFYQRGFQSPFRIELDNNNMTLSKYPEINGKPVVDVRKGRYGGTYIHRDLFTKFAAWISVEFEVAMHKTFMEFLKGVSSVKLERQNTKNRFHGLVEVIDRFYAPKQSSYQEQSRHKLMDMINMIVIGMTSKKFRTLHDKPTGDIRDYMNEDTLEAITAVEEDMKGFIEYGDITDYQKLKERLQVKHKVRTTYLKEDTEVSIGSEVRDIASKASKHI